MHFNVISRLHKFIRDAALFEVPKLLCQVKNYLDGRPHLQERGYTLQAIVLNGRRVVMQHREDVPMQMCHCRQK